MERMTNDTPYWKERLSAHDTINRQEAIEKFEPWLKVDGYSEGELNMLKAVLYELRFLPSAQPEIKPIEYRDCANAMLRMWMDNVVTDGEYNRIMDKLNARWRDGKWMIR